MGDLTGIHWPAELVRRMEEPMNIIDEIPEPHRTIIIEVLEDRDPQLLETLRTSAPPTNPTRPANKLTMPWVRSCFAGPTMHSRTPEAHRFPSD
jgi:hypothetical protein